MNVNWGWLIPSIILLLANAWIIGNDVTGVGVADDPLLLATVPANLFALVQTFMQE